MRSLSLNSLLIRNYRSFKDDLIYFPQTPGLRLLTGDNQVDKRLGANGAGKSSVWDAFVWGVTGTPIRGGKISSILAWDEIGVQVVADINVDSNNYLIERIGPPERIKINGEPATQEQVNNILGMSRMRLLHSVIFGQGIPLFPDIPVPKRGELFDEVLDLEIWSRCSDAATNKHKILSHDLDEQLKSFNRYAGMLSGMQTDESIVVQMNQWQEQWAKELLFLQGQIDTWEEQKNLSLNELDETSKTWVEQQQVIILDLQQQEEQWKEEALKILEEKASKIEELEGAVSRLRTNLEISIDNPFHGQLFILEKQRPAEEAQLGVYGRQLYNAEQQLAKIYREAPLWEEAVCPNCHQPISQEKKQFEIRAAEQQKKVSLELKAAAENGIKQTKELLSRIQLEIQNLRSISDKEQEKRKSTEKEIVILEKQIEELVAEATQLVNQRNNNSPYTKSIADQRNKVNPYIAQREKIQSKNNPFVDSVAIQKDKMNPFIGLLERNKQDRKQLTEKVDELKKDADTIEAQMIAAEYWKHGFKRIRLFFVEQILLALEIEIQSALSGLGLDNWKVSLATESETKSGSLKLGINIYIKSPKSEGSWDVWSGGETQRLRLAIAMGVSSLIQRAAGIWYNIEVWDEPTNWLGNEGIEDLLAALQYRAESQNKQIWIVDHRALTYSGFKEIYGVVKDEEGSKMIKVTESED